MPNQYLSKKFVLYRLQDKKNSQLYNTWCIKFDF